MTAPALFIQHFGIARQHFLSRSISCFSLALPLSRLLHFTLPHSKYLIANKFTGVLFGIVWRACDPWYKMQNITHSVSWWLLLLLWYHPVKMVCRMINVYSQVHSMSHSLHGCVSVCLFFGDELCSSQTWHSYLVITPIWVSTRAFPVWNQCKEEANTRLMKCVGNVCLCSMHPWMCSLASPVCKLSTPDLNSATTDM